MSDGAEGSRKRGNSAPLIHTREERKEREKMTENYTLEELVAEWERRSGLLPTRTDCLIELSTGTDVDAMARERVKRWYSRMLREAPAELLGTADFAAESALSERESDGSATIAPGARCARVLAIKLAGWKSEARPEDDDGATAQRQKHRYLRAGRANPRAVREADGRRIRVWPGGCGAIETLTGVAAPENGRYILDPVLLDRMGEEEQ